MTNQVMLIGRLVKDIELNEDKNIGVITIAVNRQFKNEEGIYETDFISFKVLGGLLHNATDFLKKGDLVGIRGRLQNRSYEDEENNKKYITEVIAEKLTFLQSKKEDE